MWKHSYLEKHTRYCPFTVKLSKPRPFLERKHAPTALKRLGQDRLFFAHLSPRRLLSMSPTHSLHRHTGKKQAYRDKFVRNRSHLEREASRDPGNRKRRLCQEISDFIRGTNKKPKSPEVHSLVCNSYQPTYPHRISADLDSLGHAARSIPRIIGPFRPIVPTLLQGIAVEFSLETPPDLPVQCVLSQFLAYILAHTSHRLSGEEQVQLARYRKILTAIPGLDEQVRYTVEYRFPGVRFSRPYREQVRYTVEYRFPGVVHLASFVSAQYPLLLISRSFSCKLEHAGKEARTTDFTMLHKHAHRYVPSIEGYPASARRENRDTRGFCHPAIARLLCPRQLRDRFDADKEGFCRDVQNGNQIIIHDDWPSFLYPEGGYNPDAIDEGLLRGPFLVSVSRSLFPDSPLIFL
jgi:hypothetical protein